MADKKTSVFGIYKSRLAAESGVDALMAAGFSSNDVSVLMSDDSSTKEFAHEKHTKAPEGGTTGAVAGGALGGTLVGALSGLGIPEYEAKRYEGRVKDGGVLVSAHCATSEDIDSAKRVLKQTGAEDIASAGEAKSGDHTDRDRNDRNDPDDVDPTIPRDTSWRVTP